MSNRNPPRKYYSDLLHDIAQLEADNAALREQVKAQSDSLLGQYRIVAEMQDRAITVERERDALRLKVQSLTDELNHMKEAHTQRLRERDSYKQGLDTLETLVNTVHHELVALFPQPKDPTLDDARAICRNRNAADAQCLYNAYNALLTHRQGMGG